MMKKAAVLLMILLALVSCRPDGPAMPEESDITTWAGLFDAWWHEMNRSYVFWSLDYPGFEWDEVRKEMLPEMEKLGEIDDNDKDYDNPETKAALRIFYDIVKQLHDGHHSFTFEIPFHTDDRVVSFSPLVYRVYKDYVNSTKGTFTDSDDKLFFNARFNPDKEERYPEDFRNESEFFQENTSAILANSFGITFGDSSASTGATAIPDECNPNPGDVEGFKMAGYVKVGEGESLFNSDVSGFTFFVGVTDDDILYLAFSNFEFSMFLEDMEEAEEPESEYSDDVYSLFGLYREIIEDPEGNGIKGVVIDLRGNGGGMVADRPLLWSPFFPKDTPFAMIRTKKSDNRQSYTAWEDMVMPGNGDGTMPGIPIAILTNSHSVSCSEMSVMAFMALRDRYGADVALIGGRTAGGNGPLTDIRGQYIAGTFNLPYITEVYTPFAQLVYIDGTSYEGIGIAPDEGYGIPYDHSAFTTRGTDARLDKALGYIRSFN